MLVAIRYTSAAALPSRNVNAVSSRISPSGLRENTALPLPAYVSSISSRIAAGGSAPSSRNVVTGSSSPARVSLPEKVLVSCPSFTLTT